MWQAFETIGTPSLLLHAEGNQLRVKVRNAHLHGARMASAVHRVRLVANGNIVSVVANNVAETHVHVPASGGLAGMAAVHYCPGEVMSPLDFLGDAAAAGAVVLKSPSCG